MTLVSTNELLRMARGAGTALACCSVYNLESVQAVLQAAHSEQTPVMLSIGNEASAHAGLESLARLALEAAQQASVSVTVHLNHGRRLELLDSALSLKIPSLMFDGSELELSENIESTTRAARLARAHGACIEGELGPLDAAYGHRGQDFLDLAKRFAAETGVDVLAVSIPKGLEGGLEPLEKLCRELCCPVAVHNASRLGPDAAALVARAGAAKVNFHSEIKEAMLRGLQKGADTPLQRLADMRAELQATVCEKLQLLRVRS